MGTPHSWSRRQFLATSGLSLLPTLQQSSAESSAPFLTWSNLYSGDQTLLADIAPAHTDGWVAVGQDTKNLNTLIVSVAPDGRARWQKTRTELPLRSAESIVQADEGYVVAGIANGHDQNGPYLTFLDTQGIIEKTTVVDTIGDLRTIELSQTDRGGYVFTGEFYAPDRHSTLVCGFDSDGRHQWTRRYEHKYEFNFMIQSSADSYIIGGNQSYKPSLWLAEITVNGTERWKDTVSPSWSFDVGAAVQRPEGGLLLAGYDYSANDTVIVRLTSERKIGSVRRYDFEGGIFEFERVENGFVFASNLSGNRDHSIRLTRADADGNPVWTDVYEVGAWTKTFLNQGATEFLLAGSTERSTTAWIAKISEAPRQPPNIQNSSPITNKTAATLHGQNTSATNSSESTEDTTPGFGLLTATTGIAAVLWKYYLEETE